MELAILITCFGKVEGSSCYGHFPGTGSHGVLRYVAGADQEPRRSIGINPEVCVPRIKLIFNQLDLLVVLIASCFPLNRYTINFPLNYNRKCKFLESFEQSKSSRFIRILSYLGILYKEVENSCAGLVV